MALAPKKKVVEAKVECTCNCSENVALLTKIIDSLVDRVAKLEIKKESPKASIHKVEEFNGEVAEEYTGGMRMQYDDKIISMKNAIAILPPNLMEDGKHTASNIGAICGFIVTEEMYDELYKDAA